MCILGGQRVCVCSAFTGVVKCFSEAHHTPAMCESSNCPVFSPILDVFCPLYFRHSGGCVVVLIHFPND